MQILDFKKINKGMEGGTMKFSERELEVIGHSLKTLYEQVKEIEDERLEGEDDFIDYLSEIKNIQIMITDNMPKETLN